jgi:hypothetical protein
MSTSMSFGHRKDALSVSDPAAVAPQTSCAEIEM